MKEKRGVYGIKGEKIYSVINVKKLLTQKVVQKTWYAAKKGKLPTFRIDFSMFSKVSRSIT
jgi:hypothetical protein